MYIEPNSTIKLFHDINLTRDYQHTLYFQNRGAQYSFFNTKVLISYEDYTYVHKEGYTGSGYIEVTATPSEVWGCNYLAYNNTSFKDKWFYCFVDDIESVSNEVQRIHFTIDVLQTWLFDVTLKDSFVERTHDADDGSNLLFDGGVPAGEMMCVARSEINWETSYQTVGDFQSYGIWSGILIQSTIDIEKLMRSAEIPPVSYDTGTFSRWEVVDKKVYDDFSINARSQYVLDGCGLYYIPYRVHENGGDLYFGDQTTRRDWTAPGGTTYVQEHEPLGLRRLLSILSKLGWLEDIVNMWVYPACMLDLYNRHSTGESVVTHGATDYKIESGRANVCYTVRGASSTMPTVTLLNKYALPIELRNRIKNEKCFQYPYTVLKITNNTGDDKILKLELFNNPTTARAIMYGETGGDAKIRIRPQSYNEDANLPSYTLDYALDSESLPMVTWANDNYNIWLAQNRGKMAINTTNQILSGLAGMAGGAWQYQNADNLVASGSAKEGGVTESRTKYYGVTGGINAGVNAITGILRTLDDQRVAKLQSNTVTNAQSQILSYQNGKSGFTQEIWTCRPEVMEQIDKYFTMYGYKVAKLMPINLKVRENFTYIQTIGVCLHSSIPKVAEDEIRAIFDRGVTFWTNNDNIGDYSVSNAPIEEGE